MQPIDEINRHFIAYYIVSDDNTAYYYTLGYRVDSKVYESAKQRQIRASYGRARDDANVVVLRTQREKTHYDIRERTESRHSSVHRR
jgi:hypothetical protein